MPRGPEIKALQTFIAPKTDNTKLKDGIFGPVSLAALEDKLKAFQEDKKLPNKTGTYDATTREALLKEGNGAALVKTLDDLKAKGKLEHEKTPDPAPKTAEPPKAEKKIEDMSYDEAKEARDEANTAQQAIHATQKTLFTASGSALPETITLNGKTMLMDTALREHREKIVTSPMGESDEAKAEIAQWDEYEKQAKPYEAQAQKYEEQMTKEVSKSIANDEVSKATNTQDNGNGTYNFNPVQVR